MDPDTGRLSWLNTEATQGLNPVHLVLDAEGKPVGRILADDVIDALLEDHRLGRRAT